MIFAYWHHSPPIRDRWVWLLILAVPIYIMRWLIHGRLWTRTPLDLLLWGFIALTAVNFEIAQRTDGLPLHRQDYWVITCRPLMGLLIFYYFVNYARERRSAEGLLAASVFLSLLIGLIGLTTSFWQDKADAFQFIIDILPRFDYKTVVPDMMLGFNPNELAGALAWLTPLMAALMLYDWRFKAMRYASGLAFACLFLALMLSQSRFAIAGVFVALALVILLLVQQARLRAVLLALLGGVIFLQVLVFFNVLPLQTTTEPTAGTAENPTQPGVSGRDENTLNARLETWSSGLRMIADYPLTGVGMTMFGTAAALERYQIPYYVQRNSRPPHAHNEWIELGTNMGLPGFFLFAGWYGVIAWMLWRAWKSGQRDIRVLVIAAAAGLLAHAGYGTGDAVRVWDRFYFLFWWVMGLGGAAYVLAQYPSQKH